MAGPSTTKRPRKRTRSTELARLPGDLGSQLACSGADLLIAVLGERVHTALYRQNEPRQDGREQEVRELAQLAQRWARFRQAARRLDRGAGRSSLQDLLDDDQPEPRPSRHEDRKRAWRQAHPGADRGRPRPWWRQLPGRLR